MGMDVYGRFPSTDVGEYFRASIWGWAPIHSLICRASDEHLETFGEPLFDHDTLVRLSCNDGDGTDDKETCIILADYLEHYAKEMGENSFEIDLGIRCCSETRKFLSKDEAKEYEETGRKCESPYKIDQEFVLEFCRFLRDCGGFNVH